MSRSVARLQKTSKQISSQNKQAIDSIIFKKKTIPLEFYFVNKTDIFKLCFWSRSLKYKAKRGRDNAFTLSLILPATH